MPEQRVTPAEVALTEDDMQTEKVEEHEIKWHHWPFSTLCLTFDIPPDDVTQPVNLYECHVLSHLTCLTLFYMTNILDVLYGLKGIV